MYNTVKPFVSYVVHNIYNYDSVLWVCMELELLLKDTDKQENKTLVLS